MPEMTFEEFKKLVGEMRQWQKGYFAQKRPEHLKKSKEAEKKVDEYLRGVQSLL